MTVANFGPVHQYVGTAAERAVFSPSSQSAIFYETDTGISWFWVNGAWKILVDTDSLTDYSGVSTVVGWSSTTQLQITYATHGKLVYVQFYIVGTSNSPSTSFTLPYTAYGRRWFNMCRAVNAGAAGNGACDITGGTNVANFYPSTALGAWTASSTKEIRGEIWFGIN